MNTPQRTVRIGDSIWFPALAKAKREGTDLSKVVRALLVEWLAEDA